MAREHITRMVEDYLTLIWKAYEWSDEGPTTTDLAASLGVTPSTVSANLKRLARDGLIAYEPYGPISLTDAGAVIAASTTRRHRIIETYLVRRLGFTWDQVHTEADLMEHAVSDRVLEAMAAALGHPTVDPHGDPIPDADGGIHRPSTVLLLDVAPGTTVTVVRVSDKQPEILRYLTDKEVGVGTRLRVTEQTPSAGLVRVSSAAGTIELSTPAASAIRVSVTD